MQLTDPGLGSGTFPVYSLHFESCASMYGPSKTFCTSAKAYWHMADALIFFLKDDSPPRPEDTLRINDSPLNKHWEVIVWRATATQIEFQTHGRSSVATDRWKGLPRGLPLFPDSRGCWSGEVLFSTITFSSWKIILFVLHGHVGVVSPTGV